MEGDTAPRKVCMGGGWEGAAQLEWRWVVTSRRPRVSHTAGWCQLKESPGPQEAFWGVPA